MAAAARVLYTKQVRKKSKTYNDGFLLIKPSGTAILYDESGKELSTATSKLPYGLAADPAAAEDLACFEGYLVQGDAACSPEDIHAARGSAADDISSAPQVTASTVSSRLHNTRQPATSKPHTHSCAGVKPGHGPPKAPQLGSRHDKHAAGYGRPAGAATGHHLQGIPSSSSSLAGRCNIVMQASKAAGMPGAGRDGPESSVSCAATLQSDMDILQLLDSITPAGCGTWDSSNRTESAPLQQHNQQQQQQCRSLPAVPQFGRSRPHAPQRYNQHNPQSMQQTPMQPAPQAGMQHAQNQTEVPKQQQQQQHPWVGVHEPQQQQQQQQCWPDAVHAQDLHQQLAHLQPQHSCGDQSGLHGGPLLQQQWQQQQQGPRMLQQQQQHKQMRQQEASSQPHPSWHATAPGVSSVTGATAFKTARNAWAAPQPALPQPLPSAEHGKPLQQQQQQGGHALSQGQQPAVAAGTQVGREAGAHTHEPSTGGILPPKPVQPRAGFNVPRAAAGLKQGAPSNALAASAGRLHAAGSMQQQEGRVLQGYCYPGPTAGPLQRWVGVPASFASVQEYTAMLTAALTEEVNLQLAEQARIFYALVKQVQGAPGGQQPAAAAAAAQGPRSHQHQQPRQQQPQHHHQKQQHAGSDASSRLQAACARAGLRYHPSASLTVYDNTNSRWSKGGWGKGKKRVRGRAGGAAAGDDEAEECGGEGREAPVKANSMYLTLTGKLDRRVFRKHDLWVISNHALLKAAAPAAGSGPYDRFNQPWVVLARSLWHGPDRDGKMEVELLPGQQQLLPPNHKWQRQQSVTALQGPDVATDVQTAEFISNSSSTRGWQLLGCLMQHQSQTAAAGGAAAVADGPADAPAATKNTTAAAAAAGISMPLRTPRAGDAAVAVGSNTLASEDATTHVAAATINVTYGRSPNHNDEQQGDVNTGKTGDDSNSNQELAPPVRRRKRRQLPADSDSSAEESAELTCSGQAGTGQTAAAEADAATTEAAGASSESDWEDGFQQRVAARPGKRIKRSDTAGQTAAADDLEDASSSSDSEAEDCGQEPAAAAPADQAEGDSGEHTAAAQQLLEHVVQRFNLNPAQAAVAAHVADWLPALMQDLSQRQQTAPKRGTGRFRAPAISDHIGGGTTAAVATAAAGKGSMSSLGAGSFLAGGTTSSSSSRSPVCLIHGPFGSGKSTLLVALIHLLTGLSDVEAGGVGGGAKRSKAQQRRQLATPRILVAAHTNVAVDRVLLGLLDAGFSNMLRVGSLPRIAKRLLGVSLHSADDSRDALSQLQSMLQNAAGGEAEMIRSEIAAIQAGAERQRRKALSTASVVGVTCCSALQSTLEGQVFDVLLLDEASQMTEPTSLIPLLRAKPRHLIAAGDPCQLPPVLTSPTGVTPSGPAARSNHLRGNSSSSRPGTPAGGQLITNQQQQQQHVVVYGLLRPLFVRLTHLGHVPHLLTHQYRCHPMLSLLSNKHFYNNRLVDGVSAAQRGPLLPGLAPLVLCDCQGGCSQAAGGGSRSSINKAEAQLVAQLVLRLLQGPAQAASSAAAGCQNSPSAQQGPEGLMECDSEDGPALEAQQLGVICFFRGQAALIQQLLTSDASCPSAADVQVATVDSFQGAEKEVIILATTTTNPHSEFCSDGARLNVALTRARRHLVVVGAAAVLSQTHSGVFKELVVMTQSGRHPGAAFMSGNNLLQQLACQ